MRFLVVLATIFSACCCFSILNLFLFYTNRQTYGMFNLAKRPLLQNILTDEEILRCLNFMDMIIKDLNERPTQEELQDILFQCNLLLQQNSKLLASKDENNSARSLQFEKHRSQEYDFLTEGHSSIENSEEVNGKNERANEISKAVSERRENDGNSTLESLSGKNEDLKEMSTDRIFKPTTESSGLGSFIFGSKGSSDNSSSVPVTDQNEGNSNGKRENQKTEFNSVVLSTTNKNRRLWNYIFRVSDSSTKSSNEKRSFGNLKRSAMMESSIYFENSTDLEYSTTENAARWRIVMPGTKWCGSGSIAANYNDLGYFEDVDRCCRTHDKCDDMMVPGESKHNLTNTSSFTVLNCKCDDELYDCLRQINSVASHAVGNTFFNILSRMCYMLDYPRTCKKYYTLLGCQEYEIDKTAEKVYQWKTAKKYLKKPFTIPFRADDSVS